MQPSSTATSGCEDGGSNSSQYFGATRHHLLAEDAPRYAAKKTVLRHFPYGLGVVTVAHGGEEHGRPRTDHPGGVRAADVRCGYREHITTIDELTPTISRSACLPDSATPAS
jgi:hypothetical protein